MCLSRDEAIMAVSSWPEPLSERQAHVLVRQLSTLHLPERDEERLVEKQSFDIDLSGYIPNKIMSTGNQ